MANRVTHVYHESVPVRSANGFVGAQARIAGVRTIEILESSRINRGIVLVASGRSRLVNVQTHRHIGGMGARIAHRNQPTWELMFQRGAVGIDGGRFRVQLGGGNGRRGRRSCRACSDGIGELRAKQRDRLDEWVVIRARVRAVRAREHPRLSHSESAAEGSFSVAENIIGKSNSRIDIPVFSVNTEVSWDAALAVDDNAV